MAYWLFKTEPDDYSYQDLEKDGRTVWDGVGNNLALKYMREVHKGDLALVYHTGDVRAAVGICEVVSEPYADPRLDDPKMVVFDVKPKKQLTKPVTLAQVKAEKAFADFLLVTNSRLSVMPITGEQWKYFST
jgi:predicted RNA-binding protein with PUA-like domain